MISAAARALVTSKGAALSRPVLAVRATAAAFRPQNRFMSKENTETSEQFDARYTAFFSKPDVDGWDIRKAMNDLCGMDVVPDPVIINAALRACRRVNDYALAVRFLEAVKYKCGPHVNQIYPYVLQEITPTLNELGIDTPEQLGYDKPELALKSVYDIH